VNHNTQPADIKKGAKAMMEAVIDQPITKCLVFVGGVFEMISRD
jgi:hypothetical protein